jgi:hypothetical protein
VRLQRVSFKRTVTQNFLYLGTLFLQTKFWGVHLFCDVQYVGQVIFDCHVDDVTGVRRSCATHFCSGA